MPSAILNHETAFIVDYTIEKSEENPEPNRYEIEKRLDAFFLKLKGDDKLAEYITLHDKTVIFLQLHNSLSSSDSSKIIKSIMLEMRQISKIYAATIDYQFFYLTK